MADWLGVPATSFSDRREEGGGGGGGVAAHAERARMTDAYLAALFVLRW